MNRHKARHLHHKKFLLLILYAILFLVACGGGGGGGGGSTPQPLSPQATLDGFTKALSSDNNLKALDYIANSQTDIYRRKISSLDKYGQSLLVDAIKNAKEVSRTDTVITYKTTMVNPDNTTVEPNFILRLENGVWKIRGL